MGKIATCLAFGCLLELVLQFLVVCSKPINNVLLLLVDLSELLIFLIVLLQLHQLLLLVPDGLGKLVDSKSQLLFRASFRSLWHRLIFLVLHFVLYFIENIIN